MTSRILPSQAAGLYDPRYEHDACGVGMVARLDNLGKGASGAAVQNLKLMLSL